MKVKKEIWVETCDFCKEEKHVVCSICGKDICKRHTLTLETDLGLIEPGMVYFAPVPTLTIKRSFCPDHLGDELGFIMVDKINSSNQSKNEVEQKDA